MAHDPSPAELLTCPCEAGIINGIATQYVKRCILSIPVGSEQQQLGLPCIDGACWLLAMLRLDSHSLLVAFIPLLLLQAIGKSRTPKCTRQQQAAITS